MVFIARPIDTSGNNHDFLKKNLELQIKSSDAVLKNEFLIADGIELLALGEKW